MRSAASSSTSCGYSPRMSYALKMSSGIVISPPCRGAARGTGWNCREAWCPGYRQMPPTRRLPAPTRQPSPITALCSCVPAPIAALAHDDAALDLGVRADDDAGLDHRFEDRRPFSDHRAGAEHGQRADPGAGLDARVLADVARRHDARPGVDVGRRGDVQILLAQHVGHRRVDGALEDIEVGLQVALGGADVAPVATVHVAVQRARLGQPREHAALDAEQAPSRDHLEHLVLQHVHARVDERRALPLARLLQEAGDAAVVTQLDEAVSPGILDRGQEDRAHAALAGVQRRERREVDVAQDVAVEHVETAVVELVGAVRDGSRRAQRFGLDGVVDVQTVAGAVADLRLDGCGKIAGGEDRALHAVPREIVEDVGDEGALDDRGHGLRHARRDGAQARALATDEDDCLGGGVATRAHARPVVRRRRTSTRGRRGRCPRTPGRPPRRRQGR